jgi:sec-independent protein translocase protein TatA
VRPVFDHGIGGVEGLILVVIVLVVFGSKRLPDSARALGRSLRIFKAETRGLTESEPASDALALGGAVDPVRRFDPVTGEPLMPFDPVTGEPLTRWDSPAGGRPPTPPVTGDVQ